MNKKHLIFPAVLMLAAVFAPPADAQTRTGKSRAKKPPVAAQPAQPVIPSYAIKTVSGLTYLITKAGTGQRPKTGDNVVVHYTGTLTNGVKFDSSRDAGQPFTFPLGQGRVIRGWDEGIAKLRVGDQAILVIPPSIGYGQRGAGNVIPPDATLIFIVELVNIEAASVSRLEPDKKTRE